MSLATVGNSTIQAAMAHSTQHPEYDELPESIKLVHSPEGYKWLGSERLNVIERETQPDFDVIE
jgi:hypothetical protein